MNTLSEIDKVEAEFKNLFRGGEYIDSLEPLEKLLSLKSKKYGLDSYEVNHLITQYTESAKLYVDISYIIALTYIDIKKPDAGLEALSRLEYRFRTHKEINCLTFIYIANYYK
jgi:hypothetical protein